MFRTLSFCLVAMFAASPALAQSVIVTESAVKTQPLSPSLGQTETLAIVTPAMAEQLIEVPVTSGTPISGEVSPSLGGTETLAIVTPAQAETMIEVPVVEPVPTPASVSQTETLPLADPGLSILDTLPRVTPEQIATIVIDTPLTVDPNAQAAEEDVSLYVMEDGTILPAASWSARDSEACKASGGVELPLPAGRIGCFKL